MDQILPSDLEYSLETSDVESFKGLDVFPIYCPGLTTIEKDGNTYCMVHCNLVLSAGYSEQKHDYATVQRQMMLV